YGSTNSRPGAALSDLQVYREQFGVEKTCLDGNASFELRLPLNTFHADRASGPTATHTALGDLAIIGKFVLLQDASTGSLLSGGLAIVAPTGPVNVAGVGTVAPAHSTVFQPFLGYLCQKGSF